MKQCKYSLFIIVLFFSLTGWPVPARREPHAGYLYPAGGQQGTVCRIIAGGQYLRGVNKAYISGDGVQITVVKHYRPVRNFKREQRIKLRKLIQAAREEHLGERDIRQPKIPRRNDARANISSTTDVAKVEWPEHPLLENIEDKNFRELQHVITEFSYFGKKQQNAQIAEMVMLEISIASNAVPGKRELRLETPLGLTRPVRFHVGSLPEIKELEPNHSHNRRPVSKDPAVDLPVVFNGRIRPGDIDRFRFNAEKGQQIVIKTQARSLIPYLADAVPGWFQATVALFDADGNEIAFADDYRFDPDPVLLYTISRTGVYQLEIRDAIYRGREDFVYRIAVGELPFITRMFPLGSQSDRKTIAELDGWNLPRKKLRLDTGHGTEHIRRANPLLDVQHVQNILYAVDDLPECAEMEPNNASTNAPWLALPRIVNGMIGKPGDVDVFRFKGSAGDEIVAEVYARRLNSPLDSLLQLIDSRGKILAWNDDYTDKASGLNTHHADSCLQATLPHNGMYYIRLTDSQQHGGDAYGYRLRLSPPQPDFSLRVTPSSLNMRAGNAMPITIHVIRKDGFKGPVDVRLKDASAGFELHGSRIPAECDNIRMTITPPSRPLKQPVTLILEGTAVIDKKRVSRTAIPAEDMMQAFLNRHLVPSRDLMVSVKGRQTRAALQIDAEESEYPVHVPTGGITRIYVTVPRAPVFNSLQFELSEPPAGISLGSVSSYPGGRELTIQADPAKAQIGHTENLIVKTSIQWQNKQRKGNKKKQSQHVQLGVLPAVPIKITAR
jgi:hypothetical protein